jgi:acetyl esterase/lipase
MTAVANESAELEGNGGWSGVSSQVQSVCSYFGVSDFVSWAQEVPAVFSTGTSGITAFLGGTPAQKLDIYRAASPVHYVSINDPPLLLFHGDHDRSVPFAQSQIMYNAYQKAGLDATLIKVQGADHNFVQATANVPISPSQEQIELSTREFFRNTLVNR